MTRPLGLYNGFSLIELAIVVFIIGLLLAGLLTPLATSVEQRRRQTMQQQFDDIEDALIGFVIVNGRLPCPATPDGDGREGIIRIDNPPDSIRFGECTAAAGNGLDIIGGNLPWTTLGVTGTDPWGNLLRYHVDADYADGDPEAACVPATANTSFSLCTTAGIHIWDTGTDCGIAVADIATIAENVPVVVVSQGSHQWPSATSCNERENNADGNNGNADNGNDANAIFVDRDYSATYDDMIFWISPFLLKSKMLKAERLP